MDCLGKRFKKIKGQNNEPLPQSRIGTNTYSSRVQQYDREESGCLPAKRTVASPNYAFSSPRNKIEREHQYKQEQVVQKERKKSTSKEKKKGVIAGFFSKKQESSSSSSSEKNKEKKKGIFGFGNKNDSSSERQKNVVRKSPQNSFHQQVKVAAVGGATGAVVAQKRSKSSSSRSSSDSKNKKTIVERIKEHLPGSGSKIKQTSSEKNQHIITSSVVKENEVQQNIVATVANYIHDEFRDKDEADFKVKGISLPGVNIK